MMQRKLALLVGIGALTVLLILRWEHTITLESLVSSISAKLRCVNPVQIVDAVSQRTEQT